MDTRDVLATAYDPDAFDVRVPKSDRPASQLQWAARRKVATDAADRVLASDWLERHDAGICVAERERIARVVETTCAHDGRNGRTWCCAACHDAAALARNGADL